MHAQPTITITLRPAPAPACQETIRQIHATTRRFVALAAERGLDPTEAGELVARFGAAADRLEAGLALRLQREGTCHE